MANQVPKSPAGRSTAATGFDELRKEVAQRNEQAQKRARSVRDVRERAQILARRHRNSL